jgi:hypothetical protein
MRLAKPLGAATIALCIFLLGAAGKLGDRGSLTLVSLQKALKDKAAGREVPELFGPILAGYRFHWELDLGRQSHLVVISRNLGGSLLAFRPDGSLQARRETQEITWLQLFDFDEDGQAEVILDEIDGRGTGILLRNFHIYRLGDRSIVPLWEGISYHRKALPAVGGHPEAVDLSRAFIRCEPSGSGVPEARLLHIVEKTPGRRETVVSRQAYSFSKGKFQRIAWPEL